MAKEKKRRKLLFQKDAGCSIGRRGWISLSVGARAPLFLLLVSCCLECAV